MLEAVPYDPSLRKEWDELVRKARNGIFLFERAYVEYHADRFPDRSFLFREKGKWIGGVAGHDWGEDGWATHRGLTFGGFFLPPEARTPDVRGMLLALHGQLDSAGRHKIRWKPLPWFHARQPSQEDRYFLFRLGARLVSCTLGTLIDPAEFRLSENHRRACSRCARMGLAVERRDDWESFWPILESTLSSRHGVNPVHSLDEIRLLASRFPERIELHGALKDGNWLAGMVIYRTPEVFHVQYSASTDEGRSIGAANFLGWTLGREQAHGSSRWMSFGNSCEQGGLVLNDGLVSFKEGFGGHAAVYEEYEYDIARIPDTGI